VIVDITVDIDPPALVVEATETELAYLLKAVDPAVLIHKNNPAPDVEAVALIEAVIIHTPGDNVILDKVEGVATATEE
jgi:hypothetical protein